MIKDRKTSSVLSSALFNGYCTVKLMSHGYTCMHGIVQRLDKYTGASFMAKQVKSVDRL